MAEKRNCPGCGAEIYYDGLCWRCIEKEKHRTAMALTEEEIAGRVAEMAANLEALEGDITWRQVDAALEGFQELLAYRDVNTADIAAAACNKEVYSPAEIYRDATPEVRDKLIARLMKPDCEEPGQIQWGLALIGDDAVQQAFMNLEENPLPWREKLHVNPSVYAEAGGWSFDDKGCRQELVYHDCIAMHSDPESEDRAVQLGKKREDKCEVCGGGLVDALVLDGRDPRLAFLGIDGVLRVPFCPWCGCFTEENVIHYGLEGTADYKVEVDPYFAENKMSPESIDEIDSNTWVLDARLTTMYRGYGGEEVPTIGGMAQWIQDWTYMTCPDCGKKMTYLASIPWDCIFDGMEGTLYIEICTHCQVARVLHQQT